MTAVPTVICGDQPPSTGSPVSRISATASSSICW
jgi:hypothetical protein